MGNSTLCEAIAVQALRAQIATHKPWVVQAAKKLEGLILISLKRLS